MFTVITRVSDLPAAWDAGLGFTQLSFQRGFLRAVEQSALKRSARLYFLQQGADGTKAAALGVELAAHTPSNPLLEVALGRFAGSMAASRHLMPATLLLQAPLSNDSPLECVGASAQARADVMDALLAEVMGYAQSRGMALVITGVQDSHHALLERLKARGFASTPAGATTVLDLDCKTWEGYLDYAGRFSRNARSAIKKEVNAATRTGLAIRPWNPEQESDALLHRILDNHWQRYNGQSFPYAAGFLEQLQQGLAGRLQVLVATRDGAVLGMSTFFAMERCGYQPFVGIVDKGMGPGSAYFNLMFYEPIRRAMDLGIERLYPGSTTYAAKVRRGCRVHPTWLFVDVRRRPARLLLLPLLAMHAAVMRRKHGSLIQAERFATLR